MSSLKILIACPHENKMVKKSHLKAEKYNEIVHTRDPYMNLWFLMNNALISCSYGYVCFSAENLCMSIGYKSDHLLLYV